MVVANASPGRGQPAARVHIPPEAIRDYLLGHATWMISDSTGIPPRYARRAGFTQTTYGTFKGSYLGAGAGDNEAFRKLWSGQPRRKLKFRYGYPDSEGNVHLMVTAPAPKATP